MSARDECPKHSGDWLYKAVRGNRINAGMPPQECECDIEPWLASPALAEHIELTRAAREPKEES